LILRRSGTNCGQVRYLRNFDILQSAENADVTRLFRTFDFSMMRSLFTLPKQARYQLRYIPILYVFTRLYLCFSSRQSNVSIISHFFVFCNTYLIFLFYYFRFFVTSFQKNTKRSFTCLRNSLYFQSKTAFEGGFY